MAGNASELDYPDDLIAFLETVWGEGYLSPGGSQEVDLVLFGLDFTDLNVLDIGCGAGGVTMRLMDTQNCAHVTGIDIEEPVLERARQHLETRDDLKGKITFQKVDPGPLPFADASFDAVFSKDALIHIPDKEALFKDIFRVLKPGGWCAASDWLRSDDNEPTPEMQEYLALEGLNFGMASPDRYAAALEAAGFDQVQLTNRNEWYLETARQELAALRGNLYLPAIEAAGKELVDHNIKTWTAMLKVLQTGEHCPHHFRGHKP